MRTRFDEMWLVTRPGPESVAADIIVHVQRWCDLKDQFDGGLDPDDILYAFDDEQTAVRFADVLLGDKCEVCGELPAVMYAAEVGCGGFVFRPTFVCGQCPVPRGLETPVYLDGVRG